MTRYQHVHMTGSYSYTFSCHGIKFINGNANTESFDAKCRGTCLNLNLYCTANLYHLVIMILERFLWTYTFNINCYICSILIQLKHKCSTGCLDIVQILRAVGCGFISSVLQILCTRKYHWPLFQMTKVVKTMFRP